MKLADNLFFYPERGGLDCNTYVFTGGPGVIIDPGNPFFLPALAEDMGRDGVDPGAIGTIVNTHLHIDHSAANRDFKESYGAKIALHPVQRQHYHAAVIEGARIFGLEPAEFAADVSLDARLSAGGVELELLPAPGHSPDCVCFYQRETRVLVCGDVLFEMNTGRVDLPGGDAAALKGSIEMLSRLDVEYLLPGHMGVVGGAARVAANFDFIRKNVFPWL